MKRDFFFLNAGIHPSFDGNLQVAPEKQHLSSTTPATPDVGTVDDVVRRVMGSFCSRYPCVPGLPAGTSLVLHPAVIDTNS